MTNRQYKVWQKSMNFGKSCGCHQLPERSFHYKNIQFPFCSRCTGIIIGQFILGPILYLIGLDSIIVALILVGLMAVDGLFQYFKILMSNNSRRLITGTLAGIGFIIIMIELISWLIIKIGN